MALALLAMVMLAPAALGSTGTWAPVVTYNAVRNEYLLVYQHIDPYDSISATYPSQIMAQRYDAAGTPVGSAVPISPITDACLMSCSSGGPAYLAVAYDSLHDRYLVVYPVQEAANSVNKALYGQLLGGDATLLTAGTLADCATPCADPAATRFAVASLASDVSMNMPRVAYDRVHGRFLVVWQALTYKLVTVDKSTGVLTVVGNLGWTAANIDIDPTTGNLYGTSDFISLTPRLLAIDKTTGAASVLGTVSSAIYGLAFNSTGQLYGSTYASLVTIDKTDGTTGTPLAFSGAYVNSGLAFDSTDALYGSSATNLYTINTSNGAVSPITTAQNPTKDTLAFDGPTLYTADVFNRVLATVDPVTNAGTTIASGGEAGISSLAVDTDGTLFGLVKTTDLVGQLVDAGGNLLLPGTVEPASGPNAGQIPIATRPADQNKAALAFEPTSGRYLVAWLDLREAHGRAYGQLLDATGALVGPGGGDPLAGFDISESPGTGYLGYPAVAADPLNSRFVTAWFDSRVDPSGDLYGHLVGSDGTVIDAPGGTPGADTIITDVTLSQTGPSIVYNPQTGRFPVLFTNQMAVGPPYTEIYSQDVLADGTPYDSDGSGDYNAALDNVRITNSTNSYQQWPSAAVSDFCGNGLVGYQASGTPNEVLVQPFGGACAPDPGLAWPDAAIAPTSGVSGEDVTASVVYYSASNTAPTLAQVWVDLNGDGQYSETPVVISNVAPQRPGPQPPAGGLAAVGGLGALLLGVLLLAWRRPRQRPALLTLSVILTVGLLAAGGLVGCNSSSSGGGNGNEEPPPQSELTLAERYDLQPADAADTDYTDGATYTITVPTGGSARTVTFRFAFSDGVKDALGSPAQAHTFTLTAP